MPSSLYFYADRTFFEHENHTPIPFWSILPIISLFGAGRFTFPPPNRTESRSTSVPPQLSSVRECIVNILPSPQWSWHRSLFWVSLICSIASQPPPFSLRSRGYCRSIRTENVLIFFSPRRCFLKTRLHNRFFGRNILDYPYALCILNLFQQIFIYFCFAGRTLSCLIAHESFFPFDPS